MSSEQNPETTAVGVRHARLEDAASVAALLAELGYPSPAEKVERRIATAVATETAIFVAVADGEVAGLLSFHCIPVFHEDSALGRITSLIIAPRCRRKGIGRRLVEAAEEFARVRGCGRIEVTSGDHRADAHAFYERLGYAQDCRRFIKRPRVD